MASDTKWNKTEEQTYELVEAREEHIAMVRVYEKSKYLNNFVRGKLREYNQLTGLGYITSSIIHDLSGPLSTVSMNLDALSEQIGENEFLDSAISGTEEMAGIIKSFKNFAQNNEHTTDINIFDEVSTCGRLLEYSLKGGRIDLRISGSKGVVVNGNKTKFNQVMLNLITNSADALKTVEKRGKRIEIRILRRKNEIAIKVKDNGPGISKEDLVRVFDPFFTTKPKGRGLGLGLFICKKIIEKDFSGKLEIESKVGRFTCVTIAIPKVLAKI